MKTSICIFLCLLSLNSSDTYFKINEGAIHTTSREITLYFHHLTDTNNTYVQVWNEGEQKTAIWQRISSEMSWKLSPVTGNKVVHAKIRYPHMSEGVYLNANIQLIE